jgi:D-psicose/D-tagatose/L-ribulose 3-epimerase
VLRFAYNTNGLQSHRLSDALALLDEAGYHGVALTLDHMHLDATSAGAGEIAGVARELENRRLRCCIETGARFVLDPRRKHGPGLCGSDPLGRIARLDYLRRCVEIGGLLGAEVVNFATGPQEADVDPRDAQRFLLEGARELLGHAHEQGVALALEPEPGHWVETLDQFTELQAQLPELQLTLDVAHVSVCTEEGTPAEAIRAHHASLALVHLEDAPRGVHSHLPFGEGDLDLPGVLRALEDIGFGGLCAVELSRHSHAAHELVFESLAALRQASP